jgi:hypothetical protein
MPLSISIAFTPSRNKKAPSRLIRRGFNISSPHLIFQGISTLLELAPASRVLRDRLLWLPRASPSATPDKRFQTRYQSLLFMSRYFFIPLFLL